MQTVDSANKMLLITANVGTIFENLNEMLDPWLDELTKKIQSLNPEFVALHMQELGGKNYKKSMQLITPFFKKLLSHDSVKAYDHFLIILDSDFTDDVNFTSLCNIYLIHSDLRNVELFNFNDSKFGEYSKRQIFSGSLKTGELFCRERFTKEFFKDFQWSRKGYIQTKWKINNSVYDFVNIHLFHDPSNLVALESTPSIYSESRKRAFEYTVKQVLSNQAALTDQPALLFIFGDFNFRLDLASFVNDYSNRSDSIEHKNDDNKLHRLVYKTTENRDIFTIEDKKFKWHFDESVHSMWRNLLKYDIELPLIDESLYELNKEFPPSYPFMEELENPDSYMDSRCPAWCDRIIFNKTVQDYLKNYSNNLDYGMIGQGVCMGDHKPIYLYIELKTSGETTVTQSPKSAMENPAILVNQNPVNIHERTSDVHDFAVFKNFSMLHPLSEIFTFQIGRNLAALSASAADRQILILDDWLRSIMTTRLELKSKPICASLQSVTPPRSDCDCILDNVNQEQLLDSALVRFFVQNLNGNLFKLKDLYTFLDAQVAASSDGAKQADSYSALVGHLNGNGDESDFRSILSACVEFLNTPCLVNLFKAAVFIHNHKIQSGSLAGGYDENFNVISAI